MSHRFKYTIRSVQSLISFKKIKKSSAHKYSTKKFKKMEAIKTIKDLGYAFNVEGQLRKINDNGEPGDQPFQFNISDKHQECQGHYEEIGWAVTQYVYELLEAQEKLIRLPVPKDSTPETGTFVFVSQDYDKKETLLVLIHGSGVVRAGQWARSLIINEKLEMGTQIPYIKKALAKNYGVMVLNTNDNCTPDGKKIPNNGSAEEHAICVWDTYISNAEASSILIVAHSYGGVVTVNLADKRKNDFDKRVKAVAFTDSVHEYSNIKMSKHFKKITKNWVSSPEPLDTPVKTLDHDVSRVSAGHRKHEMTSYSSIESVFKFFEDKLKQK